MQKHQWRQHGIGHYKSRPAGSDGPALGIIGAEGVIYNSFIERAKPDSEDTDKFAPVYEVPEAAAHTEIDNFSEEDDVERGPSVSRVVTRYINQTDDQPVLSISLLDSSESSLVPHQIEKNNHLPDTTVHTEEPEDPEAAKPPLKLKMKLAQAYLREVKENREREERDGRDNEGRDSFRPVTVLASLEENMSDIKLNKVAQPAAESSRLAQGEPTEYVECICKSCGSKCLVSDPYNFSCKQCQVKYTSLPTHMIADPLQCIGCLKVFEHKPAMKEHQSSADKERPFVCCKCGYEFKQKAHLQKHQWRIHRRKLEPDPNVKEAEAILKAVNELPGPVEAAAPAPAAPRAAPLDLSPYKMYGSSSSITAWVQQVEVARAPPTPDISILQLPQLPTEPLKLSQLPPLSGADKLPCVTIQVLPPAPPRLATLTPQLFAVKSKPPVYLPASVPSAREDNPLLNQKPVSLEELASLAPVPGPAYTDRVYKRARKEPEEEQSQPADLSINPRLDFSQPALSPPLNLSSKMSDCVPHDYTISRSELISGQLRRLRNQDERSGI